MVGDDKQAGRYGPQYFDAVEDGLSNPWYADYSRITKSDWDARKKVAGVEKGAEEKKEAPVIVMGLRPSDVASFYEEVARMTAHLK